MASLMIAAIASLMTGPAQPATMPVSTASMPYVQAHEARYFLRGADDAFAVGNDSAATRFLLLAAIKQVASGLENSARFPLIRILNTATAPVETRQEARRLLDYVNRTSSNIADYDPENANYAGRTSTVNGVRYHVSP